MIPTQRPVVENLNSHYVDLSRVTEHAQSELGSRGFSLGTMGSELW
jgi:hypothetical protein